MTWLETNSSKIDNTPVIDVDNQLVTQQAEQVIEILQTDSFFTAV